MFGLKLNKYNLYIAGCIAEARLALKYMTGLLPADL